MPISNDELRRALSPTRLQSYRQDHFEKDDSVLQRYVWNVALSTTLLPTIHVLEVGLRNAVHHAATSAFGSDMWFDNVSQLNVSGSRKDARSVGAARRVLRHRKRPETADDIVAELTFGYWVHLFRADLEIPFVRRVISDVIPYAPSTSRQRKVLSGPLQQFLHIRNRIGHHEPIWHWRTLQADHAELLKVIGWISPKLHDYAATFDKFPGVYATRGARYLPDIGRILSK